MIFRRPASPPRQQSTKTQPVVHESLIKFVEVNPHQCGACVLDIMHVRTDSRRSSVAVGVTCYVWLSRKYPPSFRWRAIEKPASSSPGERPATREACLPRKRWSVVGWLLACTFSKPNFRLRPLWLIIATERVQAAAAAGKTECVVVDSRRDGGEERKASCWRDGGWVRRPPDQCQRASTHVGRRRYAFTKSGAQTELVQGLYLQVKSQYLRA